MLLISEEKDLSTPLTYNGASSIMATANSTTVTIKWKYNSSDKQYPVKGYRLIYTHGGITNTTPTVNFDDHAPIRQHSYTIADLAPYQNYSFRLINIYEHGEGHSCRIFFATKKSSKCSFILIILNTGGVFSSRLFN